MAKGIFITGTDTGVGKTIIACALATFLKEQGVNVGVMKPIETGCNNRNGKLLPGDAIMLKKYSMSLDDLNDISPCRFKNPLAPMAAAMFEKRKVDLTVIKKSFDQLKKNHDFLIVEGIGGLLVPIKRNFFVADLAKLLGFPILIVCHPGLGTLNHTFLTTREAKKINLPIKGIVINNYNFKTRDLAYRTNPNLIKRILKPKYLTSFPTLKNLNYKTLLNASRKHLKELADIL